MKPANVALLALVGMILSSVTVYSLTPPRGAALVGPATGDAVPRTPVAAVATGVGAPERARFRDGASVTLEGRLGHGRLLRGGARETFLLLEARGEGSAAARAAAPVNLSLVIDRSGSMAGARMANAIRAALSAVDRLSDGDVVSVVAFDTQPVVVVPPTPVGAFERSRIADRIRALAVGGNTCISCGIDEGLALLERNAGRIHKMLLLSDGEANRGVLDVPGFREIARRALARGATVTTIGVDVSYNEKILTAIALESNGRHYFVEDDASLARIFEAEAEAATTAIASHAEASIDLAPGVELLEVDGRSFRREGRRVVVPIGALTRGDLRTVLLRLRVPAADEGEVPVARAELTYRDLVEDRLARCGGELALEITSDPAQVTPIDPVVAGRVSRGATGATLLRANDLFLQGKLGDARGAIEERRREVQRAAEEAVAAAPADKKAEVDRDFKKQLDDLEQASKGVAAAAAAPAAGPQQSRPARAAAKTNAQHAFDAAL